MTIEPGARLGPYVIVSRLGAGGMGEVYKARDTRLDRIVAVKVLAEALAADPDFRHRFDREARAISQLTHPNICTVYNVGEQQGTAFLVMEHLEGTTLADRLAQGPLPVDQALTIAIEVTSALSKAHRAGVVHRDLKPGNIMLTTAGAKLLDFGLAKIGLSSAVEVRESSVLTSPATLTAQGTIIGTVQYMAPEQLEGQEADARTDLFSFGAVLYEMMTGRRAFEGATNASLIGAILKDEPPPVSTLRPLAPTALDRVVTKCLAKDPPARWQSAGDLHDQLRWLAADRSTGSPAPSSAPRPWPQRAGWIAAAAVAVLASALWVLGPARAMPLPPDLEELRLQIVTRDGSLVGFAISPDRRALVYQASKEGASQLWLRALDSDTPQPLAGTEGAAPWAPFWAPDGRAIGFFAGNQLKRIDLDSGLVRTLANAPLPRGGSWGAKDTILFAAGSAGALNALPAQGGNPATVTHVDRPRQTGHRFPHFFADGQHFLFYSTGDREGRGVYVGTLGSTSGQRLFDADSAAVFLAPDWVLFGRQGALWAQRLDMTALRPLGEPAPVAPQLAVNADIFGAAALSETTPGLIAYRPGAGTRQFTWFDRTGRRVGTVGAAMDGELAGLRMSPDGRSVAFRRTVDGKSDIWTIELSRGILRKLTVEAWAYDAVWSPGSDRIVFTSDRRGMLDLYQTHLSGGGPSAASELLTTVENKNVTDWSADGKFILYSVQSSSTGADLWALPLSGDRKPFPVAQTAATEVRGGFSPDGRWLAYESNESGRSDIYVQSFPQSGRKVQISVGGGTAPVWRADGRELFFRSANDHLMAARIAASETALSADAPEVLFALPPGPHRVGLGNIPWFAAAADGQRFLVNTSVEIAPPVTVLLNWKPKR